MSKERIALETIDEACERYGCTKVFALYSGGDDSEAARLIARQHKYFVAAVHCNTGIGVEATREHVREVCSMDRCPLIEYKATENIQADGTPDPQIYEQMVMEYGFPGPTKFGHGKMYVRLKDRGIARLFREHTNRNEPIILASGCREDESVRRMETTKRIQQGTVGKDGKIHDKRRIWVNHIHNWSKPETQQYRESKGVPRNPVAKLICKSGECLCGGFGNEGELEELPWRWHERPPKWWLESKRGQQFLFEMNKYAEPGPMCQGCEDRAATCLTGSN